MGLRTDATDWEFAGLAQLGGAAGVGGGANAFFFRSASAGVNEMVLFLGGGIGAGGSLGGSGAPDFDTGRMSYSPIECTQAFSLHDLHNSSGRVSNGGVACAVGYGATYISAGWGDNILFEHQGGLGLSAGGFGLSATMFFGVWQVLRLWRSASTEEREMMREVEGSRARGRD